MELDENLELTSEEIFEIVCQESHLNTDFLKQALGCKCPFALIGSINELEFNKFSNYSVIIEDLNTHSQNVKQPAILNGWLFDILGLPENKLLDSSLI